MATRSPPVRLTEDEMVKLVRELEPGVPLSRGNLRYYTRACNVRPREIADGPQRRGRPSLYYDATDIVLVRWLVHLVGEGIRMTKFANAVRNLRHLLPEALKNPDRLVLLVVDNGELALELSKSRAMQLTGRLRGQVLFTFVSKPFVRETLGVAESLHRPPLAGGAR